MKIKLADREEKLFKSIGAGSCFEYEGEVYMATWYGTSDGDGSYSAVKMSNGHTCWGYFRPDTKVFPLDVELVVRRKRA